MILRAKDLPSQVSTPDEVRQALGTIRESFILMRQQISEIIVGQQRVIDLVLVAILSDGHVLLEGPPGLGKNVYLFAHLETSLHYRIHAFSAQQISCLQI